MSCAAPTQQPASDWAELLETIHHQQAVLPQRLAVASVPRLAGPVGAQANANPRSTSSFNERSKRSKQRRLSRAMRPDDLPLPAERREPLGQECRSWASTGQPLHCLGIRPARSKRVRVARRGDHVAEPRLRAATRPLLARGSVPGRALRGPGESSLRVPAGGHATRTVAIARTSILSQLVHRS